jgi:hypothetical protein
MVPEGATGYLEMLEKVASNQENVKFGVLYWDVFLPALSNELVVVISQSMVQAFKLIEQALRGEDKPQ